MEVLPLLEERNLRLFRFLEISGEFLAASAEGDFSGLASFEARRESILKALAALEPLIDAAARAQAPAACPLEKLVRIRAALAERAHLLAQIGKRDDQILERLRLTKERLLEEIQRSRQSAAVARKFKSAWIPASGEELDRTL